MTTFTAGPERTLEPVVVWMGPQAYHPSNVLTAAGSSSLPSLKSRLSRSSEWSLADQQVGMATGEVLQGKVCKVLILLGDVHPADGGQVARDLLQGPGRQRPQVGVAWLSSSNL